jgi:hypothetical protein
LHTVSKHFMRK